MSKTTDIKKVKEILRLKFGSHLSNRDVAKSLNVGSSTVSDIVIRFNNALLGWPLPEALSGDELTNMLYPVRSASRVVLRIIGSLLVDDSQVCRHSYESRLTIIPRGRNRGTRMRSLLYGDLNIARRLEAALWSFLL